MEGFNVKKTVTVILAVILTMQIFAVSVIAGEAIAFYKADSVTILENVTSQDAFDAAINTYVYNNSEQIKQNITSAISFSTT